MNHLEILKNVNNAEDRQKLIDFGMSAFNSGRGNYILDKHGSYYSFFDFGQYYHKEYPKLANLISTLKTCEEANEAIKKHVLKKVFVVHYEKPYWYIDNAHSKNYTLVLCNHGNWKEENLVDELKGLQWMFKKHMNDVLVVNLVNIISVWTSNEDSITIRITKPDYTFEDLSTLKNLVINPNDLIKSKEVIYKIEKTNFGDFSKELLDKDFNIEFIK
jgi:hypothetical protein